MGTTSTAPSASEVLNVIRYIGSHYKVGEHKISIIPKHDTLYVTITGLGRISKLTDEELTELSKMCIRHLDIERKLLNTKLWKMYIY
jgi:hypothetical protein